MSRRRKESMINIWEKWAWILLTPSFSTSGEMGPKSNMAYKTIASVIAQKHDKTYSTTLHWICTAPDFSARPFVGTVEKQPLDLSFLVSEYNAYKSSWWLCEKFVCIPGIKVPVITLIMNFLSLLWWKESLNTRKRVWDLPLKVTLSDINTCDIDKPY